MTQMPDFHNRATWGDGPWVNEPDRVEFTHLGFPCLLNRNHHGTWCGYVAVPPGHPCYQDADPGVGVHGGVTYTGLCSGHICHTPAPGEPDNVWWIGFDCGHCFDVSPGLAAFEDHLARTNMNFAEIVARGDALWAKQFESLLPPTVYRDLAYVRAETEALAVQLAALAERGQ